MNGTVENSSVVVKRTLPPAAMTAFSFVAAVLIAASSAAPTPLYHLYQQSMHLTPLAITIVFGIYSLSLLVTLLTVGGLSDYVGRKPVILAALLLNAFTLTLFASANGFGQLIAARIVQGMCVGTALTVLGAAILDTDRVRGPFLNSVTIFLGLMLGALGTAALVTYAPNPLHLAYEVLLALTVIMTILLWAMPESTTGRSGALASLWPHVKVPRCSQIILLRLTPGNIAAWALGAFYLSLMPTVVATTMHVVSPLIGGIVVATLMGMATVAVIALRSRLPRSLVIAGTSILSAGVVVSLLGVGQQNVALLLAGTAIAGLGFGANFSGTLRSLLPTAEPHQRAGLLAAFYVECYLAFSVPAVIAGLCVPLIGLAMAAYIYGAVVILLAIMSTIAFLRVEQN